MSKKKNGEAQAESGIGGLQRGSRRSKEEILRERGITSEGRNIVEAWEEIFHLEVQDLAETNSEKKEDQES